MATPEIGPLVSVGIRLFPWLRERLKSPDPVQVLKRREEVKKDFQDHLPNHNEYGYYCDAIVRDVRRLDSYPDEDTERQAMYPYYKVAIKDFYHRGIEVFYGLPRRIKRDMYGDWHFVDYDHEDAIKVYCVGKIPFDAIKHIDWTREDPHIYCRFKRGDPFEAKPFYTKFDDRSETVYEVKYFRPWDRKRWWQNWRLRGDK